MRPFSLHLAPNEEKKRDSGLVLLDLALLPDILTGNGSPRARQIF